MFYGKTEYKIRKIGPKSQDLKHNTYLQVTTIVESNEILQSIIFNTNLTCILCL